MLFYDNAVVSVRLMLLVKAGIIISRNTYSASSLNYYDRPERLREHHNLAERLRDRHALGWHEGCTSLTTYRSQFNANPDPSVSISYSDLPVVD